MFQLISELDNLPENILVMATTSNLDKVDKAVRRGGRLDLDIRMEMPSDTDRLLILKEHLRYLENDVSSDDLKMIS